MMLLTTMGFAARGAWPASTTRRFGDRQGLVHRTVIPNACMSSRNALVWRRGQREGSA